MSLNCGAIDQKCPSFSATGHGFLCFHTHSGFGRAKFYFSGRLGPESDTLLWEVPREGWRGMGSSGFHARHPPELFIPAANHQNEYTHIIHTLRPHCAIGCVTRPAHSPPHQRVRRWRTGHAGDEAGDDAEVRLGGNQRGVGASTTLALRRGRGPKRRGEGDRVGTQPASCLPDHPRR